METRPTQHPPAAGPAQADLGRLLAPDILEDPTAFYRALSEAGPVLWDPDLRGWIITGYAEARTALSQFSAATTSAAAPLDRGGLDALAPVTRMIMQQMLFTDAPDHTRLRALCSAAFTPAFVRAEAAAIQHTADGLLDAVMPAGRMDVVADFAVPLPAMVTAFLLGVPVADHSRLKVWSADFAALFGPLNADPATLVRALRSVDRMATYFTDALHRGDASQRGGMQHGGMQHGVRHGRGLLHALAAAELDGARLSEAEVVANAVITLVGGLETTTNLIAGGLLRLLLQPDQLARLRDEPSLLESGVEELLRFEAPAQSATRRVPHDQVLGGCSLRRGETAVVVIAAANRDPARFDEPDRLDLGRVNNRHLSLGWGPHFCFGAVLARLEAQIAFRTLLSRLTGLALPPQSIAWHPSTAIRGPMSVEVSFDVPA